MMMKNKGAIAQLGERLHGMQEVGGSSPPSSHHKLMKFVIIIILLGLFTFLTLALVAL